MKAKKILFALPFALFLIGFSIPPVRVWAQETVTATITSHPIMDLNTPTPPASVGDSTCPEDGIIDGWMTRTPSAIWSLICESCVITPFPTSTLSPPTPFPTWDGTGTPRPTPTITTTPSPVPPPPTTPPTVAPYDGLSYSAGFQYHNGVFSSDNVRTLACHEEDERTVVCSGEYSGRATQSGYPPSLRIPMTLYLTNRAAPVGVYFWSDYACEGCLITSSPPTGYVGTLAAGHNTAPYSYPDFTIVASGVGIYKFAGTLIYTVNATSPFLGTPTPTPMPYYCSSVPDDEDDDKIFGFDGLEFGVMKCVDLFDFSLSVLGLDISIPLFAHICFQDVSLGNAYIFGFGVDMDAPLYLLGITWAIRNLITS